MELENNKAMEKIYADTFRRIEPGDVLQGRIISVKQDGVIVDIGYKSEGFVHGGEFSQEALSSLKEGDSLAVYVVSTRAVDGLMPLSREKALKLEAWDTFEAAFEKGTTLQGTVTGKTKGGVSVDIFGVKAFMPASQIDNKSIKELEGLEGKPVQVKIITLDTRRSNIIVSRRAALEEERQKQRVELLPKLKERACLEGVVKNITDYGVFIDLGGIDGLLHISDISWGRITHPAEFFTVGDTVSALILKYDEEHGRVTLGYKQLRPDPWLAVDEKYHSGAKVRGKVVSLAEYGAFIELEDGIEGLVHVSEIDWVSRPKHPSKYLSIGETIEAVILKVNKDERRLSLSIKQLNPSPWELVSQRYAAGQKVTGKIRGVTEFGAFVGLPEGIDGLIHISDISWTRHIKHPSEVLKKGQAVEAVILSLEPEKERLALGLKQLSPDPWVSVIPEKFKVGDEVKCKVLKLTDFGVFVEIEGEAEGLIYSSEVVKPEEPMKEGDVISAKIIKVEAEDRKIGLSMKLSERAEGDRE